MAQSCLETKTLSECHEQNEIMCVSVCMCMCVCMCVCVHARACARVMRASTHLMRLYIVTLKLHPWNIML